MLACCEKVMGANPSNEQRGLMPSFARSSIPAQGTNQCVGGQRTKRSLTSSGGGRTCTPSPPTSNAIVGNARSLSKAPPSLRFISFSAVVEKIEVKSWGSRCVITFDLNSGSSNMLWTTSFSLYTHALHDVT
jgi:hypothetical protein